MNIALIAHDNKKALMQNLCVAYQGILEKHVLYSTGTTGRLIEDVTTLKLHKTLAGILGGEQQVAALITENQLDLLLYLRDPSVPMHPVNENMDLLMLCDLHNIPVATNLASAEAMIQALRRGDLDWRNLYH